MASMEQQKADENVLRLVEAQKREKEAALIKILNLEKQLDAKQKLELEITELKGSLEVMKHMGDDDDMGVKKKIIGIATDMGGIPNALNVLSNFPFLVVGVIGSASVVDTVEDAVDYILREELSS